MGSLLPANNESQKFAQLYVYDTYNEVENRLRAFNSDGKNERLDPTIVEGLIRFENISNSER